MTSPESIQISSELWCPRGVGPHRLFPFYVDYLSIYIYIYITCLYLYIFIYVDWYGYATLAIPIYWGKYMERYIAEQVDPLPEMIGDLHRKTNDLIMEIFGRLHPQAGIPPLTVEEAEDANIVENIVR